MANSENEDFITRQRKRTRREFLRNMTDFAAGAVCASAGMAGMITAHAKSLKIDSDINYTEHIIYDEGEQLNEIRRQPQFSLANAVERIRRLKQDLNHLTNIHAVFTMITIYSFCKSREGFKKLMEVKNQNPR